jgi:hypothetical protein
MACFLRGTHRHYLVHIEMNQAASAAGAAAERDAR